ncbi:UNVERIFIED_CONTAM: hypothetical protein PYX00_009703 [Menopon gallinae]|uniref:Uncharacterized protein n=1 Tax=Menopon gallinae TaxID=328185 RepID=A0AAW2HCD1_9NEOP
MMVLLRDKRVKTTWNTRQEQIVKRLLLPWVALSGGRRYGHDKTCENAEDNEDGSNKEENEVASATPQECIGINEHSVVKWCPPPPCPPGVRRGPIRFARYPTQMDESLTGLLLRNMEMYLFLVKRKYFSAALDVNGIERNNIVKGMRNIDWYNENGLYLHRKKRKKTSGF